MDQRLDLTLHPSSLSHQAKLEGLEEGFREEVLSRQQLEAENESLREQLAEAHETTAQLTSHVADLQDKWEECSVHLKEAQDEIQSLKEASVHRFGCNSTSAMWVFLVVPH